MLDKNMGTVDRGVRFVVGAALIVSALTGTLGAWAYIGIIPVLTSLIGSCPAYTLLDVKTCKSK
jgi:hypothetical protein